MITAPPAPEHAETEQVRAATVRKLAGKRTPREKQADKARKEAASTSTTNDGVARHAKATAQRRPAKKAAAKKATTTKAATARQPTKRTTTEGDDEEGHQEDAGAATRQRREATS